MELIKFDKTRSRGMKRHAPPPQKNTVRLGEKATELHKECIAHLNKWPWHVMIFIRLAQPVLTDLQKQSRILNPPSPTVAQSTIFNPNNTHPEKQGEHGHSMGFSVNSSFRQL